MGFEKFVDKESGREFLYNKSTGQTKWTTSNSPSGMKKFMNLSEVELGEVNKLDGRNNSNEGELNETDEASDSSSSAESESQALVSTPAKTTTSAKSLILGVDTSSPTKNPVLSMNEDRSPTQTLTRRQEQNRTISMFRCCLTFHSCCCEGPMAVAEGYTKAVLYAVAAAALFLMYLLTVPLKKPNRTFKVAAFACLRESILFFAASVTLMIPCSATVSVYGRFKPEEDWEMGPIPTFVGFVDPRRFSTFEGGDGAIAVNYYKSGATSMDSWKGIILNPPGEMCNSILAKVFGQKNVPKRRHLVEEIELELEMAQKAIDKEKKLENEGWGIVGV